MGKEKIDIIEFKTSGFAKIGFLTLALLIGLETFHFEIHDIIIPILIHLII